MRQVTFRSRAIKEGKTLPKFAAISIESHRKERPNIKGAKEVNNNNNNNSFRSTGFFFFTLVIISLRDSERLVLKLLIVDITYYPV